MMKYMAVAVAVAVSGGVAVPVAVPVAGLTKRFFNQKDFLINVWGYCFLGCCFHFSTFCFEFQLSLILFSVTDASKFKQKFKLKSKK